MDHGMSQTMAELQNMYASVSFQWQIDEIDD